MSEEKDILTFEIKNEFAGNLVCTYDARPALDWLEKLFEGDSYPTDAIRKEVVEMAREMVFEMIEPALHHALSMLIADEVPIRITSGSIDKSNLPDMNLLKSWEKEAQALRLAGARARMKANFETLETRGRKRNWTRYEFVVAIEKTLTDYKKKHYRLPNLENMATALNKRYPKKPQFNGETLRKALNRYEIDWKQIKNRNK